VALLVSGVALYWRKRKQRRRVVFDIEYTARIVESSTTAALQRMRQANEKLGRAQQVAVTLVQEVFRGALSTDDARCGSTALQTAVE
jgi:hypothetical protein